MSDNLEKALPATTIELDGKERNLVIDMYAGAQFQKLTGLSLLAGGFQKSRMDAWLELLWAALLRDQPELDGWIDSAKGPSEKVVAAVRKVGQMVPAEKIVAVINALDSALGASQPPAEAGEKKE